MKIEFERIQTNSPSIVTFPEQETVAFMFCPSGKWNIRLQEKKHISTSDVYIQFTKTTGKRYFENKHFPPFSFKYIYPEKWQLIQTLKGSIDFNTRSWMKTAFPEAS